MGVVIAVIGAIAGIFAIVGGLFGAFKWLTRGKTSGRPESPAEKVSVSKGNLSGQANVDNPTSAYDSATAAGPGSHVEVHHHYAKSEEQERFQASVSEKLDILLERSVAPPPGAPTPDTTALTESANQRTERLLGEAIDLQHQHREEEAIKRLLTAWDMELSPEAKAQLHLLAGNGYLRLSRFVDAESQYRQSLEAAQEARDRTQQAAALGGLGLVYSEHGDLDKAEEYIKKALAIHEEIGGRRGQAQDLGNLGGVYHRRGALDKAKRHYERALAIQEEIGDRLGQASQLGNLGLVYSDHGDLDKAEEHHKKALAIDEEIGNRAGQAHDLGNLGLVYSDRGDLDKAEEYYKNSLPISEEIGDRLSQARQLGNLGGVYFSRGDLEKAAEYYKKALAIFTEIGAAPEIAITQQNLEELQARKHHD